MAVNGKPSSRPDEPRRGTQPDPLAGLKRKSTLAGYAVSWERIWPRLAVPLCIAGLFLALAWMRAFDFLPDMVRVAAVALFGLAFLASLIPLVRLRRPSEAETTHRLERDSGYIHQPLVALGDTQVGGRDDPVAQALWIAHRRRAAAALDRLRVAPPSPRLDRRDPWALRAAVFLLFIVGLAAMRGDPFGPVADAVRLPRGEVVEARIDAWVTPPAYTRRAPIFLTNLAPDAPPLTIPEGSVLSIRVTGVEDPVANFSPIVPTGEGAPEEAVVALERADEAPAANAPGSTQITRPAAFETTIDRSGTVSVGEGDDAPLKKFDFAVTADNAPTIRLSEEPAATSRGAFRLAYEVEDDFRVAGARALFEDPKDESGAAGASEARPLVGPPDMPLTLPRRSSETSAAETFRDLSAHPWAGGVTDMRLEARDDAGNIGVTLPIEVVIPARPFREPLARMLVEQRRTLAMDAEAAYSVADTLDTVMLHAPTFVDDASVHLGLRVIRNRIVGARDDEALRDVLDLMWEMALAIDGGDASLAEQRLREARERLREALQNDASPEEIARLMDELRKALDEYMQALEEQLRNNPDLAQELSPQDMQRMQEMTPQDLQSMIDRMQELAELGDREAAEQLLSQLDQMLENLQMGRPQQGQQPGEQSQMDQMMNELADMIRRQQELMNETFRMSPDGAPQQGQNGQQQPMTPEEMEQAMRQLQEGQGDLQQRLEDMLRQLQEGGMQPGDQLGEAGRSMGEAEGSLGEGQPGEALGQQGRALEQLRQGAQQLAEQMQQGEGEGQGPGQRGRTAYSEDPLGRPQRREGPDFGDSVKVPGEIDVQRARRILEELRRRFSDENRPTIELDYLRRLLNPF
ncbi:MAG TPA: TIGR02302 family protein [Methylomirabilota bacterium]|nr:TIGR02302 family protein [Methylomirabilota bacterium]